MKRIEITATNIDRFDDVALSMATGYQEAFSGDPWYETSRCQNLECATGFSACQVGLSCQECSQTLVEAYDADDLVKNWRTMLENEDAFIEAAVDSSSRVLRTTIARPTTPEELAQRKYSDNPEMAEWADDNLPTSMVWIEDTFANRNLSPRRNLDGRGRTLARIAMQYSIDAIATRTIAPQIVRATLRDVGSITDLNIGTNKVGEEYKNLARSSGQVPDWRTMLIVDGKGVTL